MIETDQHRYIVIRHYTCDSPKEGHCARSQMGGEVAQNREVVRPRQDQLDRGLPVRYPGELDMVGRNEGESACG
jgi:hypothetical protein